MCHIPKQDQMGTVRLTLNPSPPQAPVEVPEAPARKAARPKASAADVRGLQAELDRLRDAIARLVAPLYICRPRAKILRKAARFEDANPPAQWRTECDWAYGLSNVLRTNSVQDGFRRCKKCFDLSDDSSSSTSDLSGISDQEGSSASSADK